MENIKIKRAFEYRVGDSINGHIIKEIDKRYLGHISMADIDLDIENREEVKFYLRKKYGIERFAIIGSYNAFKIKSGIKDLARELGSNLDYEELNFLTNTLFFKEGKDAFFEEIFKTAQQNTAFKDFVQNNVNLINAIYWLIDTPKSSSVHPCATMLVPDMEEDIFDLFPLFEQKSGNGEYICEWEGGELEELGFLKEDLLGLSQLEFLHNICDLIKKSKGEDLNIFEINLKDNRVFEHFQNGWNSEIFQFNSNLLVNYCKLLRPTEINDLIATVSLVRPGPLNSGSHIKYAKRKHKEEEIEYFFGFEQFTKETYGLLIYQEQISQIGSYLGDLTLVEADGLRKCICGSAYIWREGKGFVKFQNIANQPYKTRKFQTNTINLVDTNLSLNICDTLFKQSMKKDCLRVWTKGGYIECSRDHLIYTNYGWTEVQNLTKDHYILKEKITKFGKETYDLDKLYLTIALTTEGKVLPDWVFELNKETLKYVIGWLFNFDGCVIVGEAKKSINISYTSVSIELINQVSLLLSQFNIECTITEDLRERCKGNYFIGLKSSKDIHIFYDEFKLHCKKINKLKGIIEEYPNKDTSQIPYNIWFPIIDNLIKNSGYTRNELIDSILKNSVAWKNKRGLEKELLKKVLELCGRSKELENYLTRPLYWSPFWKIEELGEREVYDFTMSSEVSPQAFINNCLMHNCMGKKIMAKMLEFKEKIKPNALLKGCSPEEFEKIWELMEEFAKYGFNKSHAAAYSITGYISQYLKVYYPIEFWVCAFEKANASDKRKLKFNQYFEELESSKSFIKVVSPDINLASNKTTFEGNMIYFPLNNIKYLSNEGVENIIGERKKDGKYYSLEEFCVRLSRNKLLDKREIINLILSGTFDEIENLKSPKERKKLIIYFYNFLRKDYREFFIDPFQQDDLWWDLKQWELLGVTSINYDKLCQKYFERYSYFRNIKDAAEGRKIVFGGIIIDIKEKTTKKGKQFGEVFIENNNVPYSIIFWTEEWILHKEKIEKSMNNILLFEGEVNLTNNDKIQFVALKESNPIILGSDKDLILEKPKVFSVKKFDRIKMVDGTIGTIVRYPSNSEIIIKVEETKLELKITKWEIEEIINY